MLHHLPGWPVAIAASLAIFATPARLHGPLLYDDKAAVLRNPVVIGSAPRDRVWVVDFWGEHELQSAESHKSWRPLVTLSYRANFAWHGSDPFGYHCINAAIHATVSALVEPAALAAFGCNDNEDSAGRRAASLAAIFFAVHPVHVEAVQNIVGRAELLMSLFYLSGFLSYCTCSSRGRPAAAVALALLFALCATLCKETGITLPALCALWELLVACPVHPQRLLHYLAYYTLVWPTLRPGIFPRPTSAILLPGSAYAASPPAARADARSSTASDASAAAAASKQPRGTAAAGGAATGGAVTGGAAIGSASDLLGLAARIGALAVGAALLCAWRLSLNGGSAPRFNAFENPAALHPHPLYRSLSVIWVWAEYCWTVACPNELSCDWSYPSLPPITSLYDARLPALVTFVCGWAGLVSWAALLDTPRPRVLMAIAFGLLPFALASNLVTVVGTSKAERLLYLPSAGGCMLAGLLFARMAGCDDGSRRAFNGAEGGEQGAGDGGGEGGGRSVDRPEPAPNAPVSSADGRQLHQPRWQLLPTIRAGVAWVAALLLVGALCRQCAWYADVWSNGVLLWENAVQTQDRRPGWLRGGVTTHALAEYGMQLSWAGRQEEAAAILERQIMLCEADLQSKAWPNAGRLQAAGYASLSIVYRLLGERTKSIAIAERGLSVIRLSGGGSAQQDDASAVAREAARCLAAKALSVYSGDSAQGIELMRSALQMGSSDSVVLALAKQLDDHLQAVGAARR